MSLTSFAPSLEGSAVLSLSIDDATLCEVVRREFYSHLVTGYDSDEVFSHSTRNVSHHFAACFQLHTKSRIRQCLRDGSFDFEGLFFISQNQTSNQESLSKVIRDYQSTGCIDVRESGNDTVHIGMVKREPQVQQ